MLELAAICDQEYAVELKAALQLQLAAGTNIDLDASNVDEVSTSFVHLVESAVATTRQAGVGLAIHNPSDAFIAAYEDLGLLPNLMQIFAEPV